MEDRDNGPPVDPEGVTQLLHAARSGDEAAADRLFAVVYADLKRIARRQLGRVDAAATLTATALVHEAYLRLARPGKLDLADRTHFFAVAARAMRQILVDRARRRMADKRGGGVLLLELDEMRLASVDDQAEMMVALDDALGKLERADSRLSQLVEWRFFGGMTLEEVAASIGRSERTLKRDWRRAKAFLYRELTAGSVPP